MKTVAIAIASAALCLAGFAATACDETSTPSEVVPTPDSGNNNNDSGSNPGDSGPQEEDCFKNPKTHYEIINACTTATKVDKKVNLPLLLSDGGRPPIPP
jgi:hypothetical protein